MSRPSRWSFGLLVLLYGLIVLGLFACKQEPAPSSTVTANVTSALPAQAVIPAQVGFWADATDACPTANPKPSTVLHWDVSDLTQDDVIVYVSDPNSKHPDERQARNFSKGGPKDEHKTGPWLTPGMVFTLKEDGTGKELGVITITARADCPK